jgi:hypothetical protein
MSDGDKQLASDAQYFTVAEASHPPRRSKR